MWVARSLFVDLCDSCSLFSGLLDVVSVIDADMGREVVVPTLENLGANAIAKDTGHDGFGGSTVQGTRQSSLFISQGRMVELSHQLVASPDKVDGRCEGNLLVTPVKTVLTPSGEVVRCRNCQFTNQEGLVDLQGSRGGRNASTDGEDEADHKEDGQNSLCVRQLRVHR